MTSRDPVKEEKAGRRVERWYENGQKEIETRHKEGTPDFLVTCWYENGQKAIEGTYKEGQQDADPLDRIEMAVTIF